MEISSLGVLETRSPKSRCWQGGFSRRLCGRILARCSQFLVAPGNPGSPRHSKHHSNLRLCPHRAFPSVSGTSLLLEGHPSQIWRCLPLLHLQRPFFQRRSYPEVLSGPIFSGPLFNPLQPTREYVRCEEDYMRKGLTKGFTKMILKCSFPRTLANF